MKKYINLVLCFILGIVSVFVVSKGTEQIRINNNRTLFYEQEIPTVSKDIYEKNAWYVLLKSSNQIKITNPENQICYLAKIGDKSGNILELTMLDNYYQALGYDQTNERLVLVSNQSILTIDDKEIKTTSLSSTIPNEFYRYSILMQPNMKIVVESIMNSEALPEVGKFPPLGYRHVIDLAGISDMIPIGVAQAQTKLTTE